ncbi:hypothetical protein L204_105066 [Cryptococcus depauperatus]
MSSHPTRSGRHSLPASIIITGTSSRPTIGGIRYKDGSVLPPLPQSLSLGNLCTRGRGQSIKGAKGTNGHSLGRNGTSTFGGKGLGGPTGGKKEKGKKKKKGMKGWAWVLEDEEGNVIDIQSDEDEGTKETDVADTGVVNHFITIPPLASSGTEVDASIVNDGEALDTATTVPDTALVTPKEEEKHMGIELQSPQSQGWVTVESETTLGKRAFKSSSPVRADESLEYNAATLLASQATEQEDKDEHRPKQRRKTTPTVEATSAPTAPSTSSSTTSASISTTTTAVNASTPVSKSAPRRTQPTRQPTLLPGPSTSGPSAVVRTRLATRDIMSHTGLAHVVDNDTPLAVPPRLGMGEGKYTNFKESALREEQALRKEAMYMIDEAKRKRALGPIRDRGIGIGIGRIRDRTRKNWNLEVAPDDEEESFDRRTKSREDLYSEDEWDSDVGPSSRKARPTIKAPPIPPPTKLFEEEFEEIQNWYRRKAADHRASLARRPPDLSKLRDPVVVVATHGKETFPRDRTERGYHKGLSGLNEDMEADAQGFVQNVRANLTGIATYYFPQRTAKRDAFLDRIGRGLQRLGQELTDNGDAAVLP